MMGSVAQASPSWWPGPRIDLGKLDSRAAVPRIDVVNSGRCNVGAPGEASPVPRFSIGRTPQEKWIHPWLELGGTVSSRTPRRPGRFKGGIYPPLQHGQGPDPPVLLGPSSYMEGHDEQLTLLSMAASLRLHDER